MENYSEHEETISEAQSILDSRYEKLELKKRNWDDVKIPASRMANAVQRYSLVDGLLYYNSPQKHGVSLVIQGRRLLVWLSTMRL